MGTVGVGTPDIGRPLRTKEREWIPFSRRFTKPLLGTPEGTADEFMNGVLFSDWISGKHGPMTGCIDLVNLPVGDTDREAGRAGSGRAALSPVRDIERESGSAEWTTGIGGILADEDEESGSVEWTEGTRGTLSDDDREDGSVGRSEGISGSLSDDDSEGGSVGRSEGVGGALEDDDQEGGETGISVSSSGSLSDDDSEDGDWSTYQGGDKPVADLEREAGTTEASSDTPPEPGSTCATAGVVTPGFSGDYTVAASTTDWFSVNVTSGTTYHLRVTDVVGAFTLVCNLYHGSCSSLTTLETLFAPGCVSHVASSTETWWIAISGSLMGSVDYHIEFDTGGC